MATAPANDTLQFEQVDDTGFVRVEDVEVGKRLRSVDPVWADALGSAMLREGQATPIVICRLPGQPKWMLVAGAHRLEGARLHGIEQLKAEIISARVGERAQREISENLWRRGLDPLERAAFIAKQVEIIKIRKGIDPEQDIRSVAAQVRWNRARGAAVKAEAADASEIFSHAYGWSDEIAEKLGVSAKTVTNALALYRQIPPSAASRLRAAKHPIIDNASELSKLAKLTDEELDAVVDLLIAGRAKRVAEAKALVSGKHDTSSPEDKRLSTFVGTFQRMTLSERHGALQQLPLPAGTSFWHGQHRADMLAALNAGFAVLTGLLDGEPTDDDALLDAAGKLQQMLHTIQGVA